MKLSRRRIGALVALGLVWAAVVAVAAVLVRGIPFPAPTGPYKVGRASYHLIDESRAEIFTEEPNDVRELMITVHYPADQTARAPRAPYADPSLAAGIAEVYSTPEFVGRLMCSHALEKPSCEVHEGGFPVVIFSPGFGTPTLFYTATLEDLASHGFIVASVYHPYSLGVTAFPDGRIVQKSAAASDTDVTLFGYSDRSTHSLTPVEDVGSVWVKDVRFVLDQLTRMNRDDQLLAGRMDLARVGVFGHSFGGATSLRTMQLDDRFLAGINMDGADFLAAAGLGVSRPFLWLTASEREITDADLARSGKTRAWAEAATRVFHQRSTELLRQSPQGSRAMLRGAAHLTFTSDLTLLGATWPWSMLVASTDRGKIAGRRAVVIENTCVVDFFRRNLGQPTLSSSDSRQHDFPELEWQTRQP